MKFFLILPLFLCFWVALHFCWSLHSFFNSGTNDVFILSAQQRPYLWMAWVKSPWNVLHPKGNSFTSRSPWSEVAQSCPTLCDPEDCSLPDSSIHGILQQEYWSGLPWSNPHWFFFCLFVFDNIFAYLSHNWTSNWLFLQKPQHSWGHKRCEHSKGPLQFHCESRLLLMLTHTTCYHARTKDLSFWTYVPFGNLRQDAWYSVTSSNSNFRRSYTVVPNLHYTRIWRGNVDYSVWMSSIYICKDLLWKQLGRLLPTKTQLTKTAQNFPSFLSFSPSPSPSPSLSLSLPYFIFLLFLILLSLLPLFFCFSLPSPFLFFF